MRITDEELSAWMAPLVGKQGEAWPNQRTFHAILRGGELHRFEGGAHVLVCRSEPGGDAHLITTGRRLAEGLSPEEQAFVKATLIAWAPKTVWLAWLQRDTKMAAAYQAMIDASGLAKVTRKKISGWALAVGVTMAQLEALMVPNR